MGAEEGARTRSDPLIPESENYINGSKGEEFNLISCGTQSSKERMKDPVFEEVGENDSE